MDKKSFFYIDQLINITIIAIVVFFITDLDYKNSSGVVVVSFFLNGMYFLFRLITHIKSVSLYKNIYIFQLIFFFCAPLQQYLNSDVLWSTTGLNVWYTDKEYLYANVLIFFFSIFFDFGYILEKRKKNNQFGLPYFDKDSIITDKKKNLLVLLSLISTVLVLYFEKNISVSESQSSLQSAMIVALKFLPSICYIICSESNNKHDKFIRLLFIFELCILMVFRENSTPRFLYLGSVMTILSLKFYKSKVKEIYTFLYICGFFFLFTFAKDLSNINNFSFTKINFDYFDFDAYQIFLLAIKYVSFHGFLFGKNIVSVLLFFIPRTIANWRLENTGSILVTFFGSSFANVSCPLIAELYISFGLPFLLIMAFIIGKFVMIVEKYKTKYGMGLFFIISGLSMYILRGSLLTTFSSTMSVIIMYTLMFYISRNRE